MKHEKYVNSITFAVWYGSLSRSLIGLIVVLRRQRFLQHQKTRTWHFYMTYLCSVMFVTLNALKVIVIKAKLNYLYLIFICLFVDVLNAFYFVFLINVFLLNVIVNGNLSTCLSLSTFCVWKVSLDTSVHKLHDVKRKHLREHNFEITFCDFNNRFRQDCITFAAGFLYK